MNFHHEALLWSKLRSGKIKCLLCERQCIIPMDDTGFCGVRLNLNGTLYSLSYGKLSAVESRLIEVKPFFHFWPSSTALTFSTWGCNFNCPWCQNWHLSMIHPDWNNIPYIPPKRIVELAVERGDSGVCVSFNEPLMLFEYSLDVFRIARSRGLYSTYVSNGYMSIEALKLLRKHGLNGLKVDVKGGEEVYKKYCGGVSAEHVWKVARSAREMNIHVEIVYLLVTGVNCDEYSIKSVIERHLKEVGCNTPLHFTRYFPAYRFHNPPTSINILEYAYKLAKKLGVNYPYIGNVPGHPYENTYCPNCGEMLIKRFGSKILKYNLKFDGRCPRCGYEIPIINHLC